MRTCETLKPAVSDEEADQFLWYLNEKLSEKNMLLLKSSIEKRKEMCFTRMKPVLV